MVELSALSSMLETMLNTNKYDIIFDVKADRNEYDEAKKITDQFIVPGVLTALSGNYEPLQGIKVYTMPVNLDLWCYASLESEYLRPEFSFEQQKECVGSVVESLNGTTQTIDNNAVIFAGTVVTVGNATNDSGGGYTRIPILVQFSLTIVEGAVFSNDVAVSLDGVEIYTNEFSVNMEKQSESYTYVGQSSVNTQSAAVMRTFGGMLFLLNNDYFKALEADMLDGATINKTHTLVFKGRTYSVIAQTMSELLRMGAIVVLQATFVEK